MGIKCGKGCRSREGAQLGSPPSLGPALSNSRCLRQLLILFYNSCRIDLISQFLFTNQRNEIFVRHFSCQSPLLNDSMPHCVDCPLAGAYQLLSVLMKILS